jgi:uncharacterized integral membrane protein
MSETPSLPSGGAQPPSPQPSSSVQQQRTNAADPGEAAVLPLTRTGVAWWALGFSLVLLVLVLIFVLQNLSDATTSFFGLTWTIPLGLDLLLATLLGGVIAFLLGAARMLQIRRVARRYARARHRA